MTPDFVVETNKRYYLQTLFEECKYEIKKTKMENIINGSLKPSSYDNESNSETESDSKSDNESNDNSDE